MYSRSKMPFVNILNFLLLWTATGENSTHAQEAPKYEKPVQYAIYDKLMRDYKKDIRPNIASNEPINVTIDIVLYSIEETDELHQAIAFNIWFHMEWVEPTFKWKPSDYKHIDQIEILPTKIWMPDLYLKGVREDREVPEKETTACDVYSHGVVHCEFNKRLTCHCDYHIARFPYDTQNCTLEFGSWKYGMAEVDIYTNSSIGNTKFFKTNNEWDLVSFNNRRVVKASSRKSFAKIFYSLVIRRKPIHYVMILILPSFLITTLALLGLFSPFSSTGERQERITMGLTMLLTMSVLLLVVSEQMPQSSSGFPPLLGLYILFEFFLGALGTCFTIMIMHVQQRSFTGKEPPKWLYYLLCLKCEIGMENQVEKIGEYGLVKNEFSENEQKAQKETSDKTQMAGEDVKILKSCLGHLQSVSNLLDEKKIDENLSDRWRVICGRLDIVCMFLLLSFNSLLSIVSLIVLSIEPEIET